MTIREYFEDNSKANFDGSQAVVLMNKSLRTSQYNPSAPAIQQTQKISSIED